MSRASQPALLVIGGAKPSQGMRCVRQAQTRGLRVVLLDSSDNLDSAPEIAAAADRVIRGPFDQPDACLEIALEHASSEHFVGVFGWREYAMESVAAVAEALGLPGNGRKAVATVRDKYACREALRLAGFAQPCARRCSSLGDALEVVTGGGAGPWIVKPKDAMGSVGVGVVRGPMDAARAYAALPERHRSDFLIEEFQSGTEYSAEGVFVEAQPQVITLTTKHLMEEADCFIERGHVIPALLPEPVSRRARQVVEAALRALGLVYGVFHVEFWIDGDRIVLGEVHVRPGGDYIHLMVELVTGLELYGLVYDQLLGRVPDPSGWRIQGGAAVLYFTPPAGRVVSIGDAAAVSRDPACVRLDLPLRPGDTVPAIRESEDRPGFVLARADAPQAAWTAAQRLHDMIDLRVLPESAPSR